MNSRKLAKVALFSLTVVVSATSFYFTTSKNYAASNNSVAELSLNAPVALPLCPIDGCCPPSVCDDNPPPPPPPPTSIDVTGKWKANDGGTYYLRRVGNQVWWYGEFTPTSPPWSNVFLGTIVNGNQISGNWADVPKGNILGSGGIVLRIESNNRIVRISNTGNGFGGTVWTR